jgi:hypothetical protein
MKPPEGNLYSKPFGYTLFFANQVVGFGVLFPRPQPFFSEAFLFGRLLFFNNHFFCPQTAARSTQGCGSSSISVRPAALLLLARATL